MHARVVRYNLKVDQYDEAVAALEPMLDQIGAFPGLRSWVNVGSRETGQGTAMAVFDTLEALEAVTDQVNQILAGFGAYFSAPPTVDIGEVVAYIDKS
jgi:hypothetical protein